MISVTRCIIGVMICIICVTHASHTVHAIIAQKCIGYGASMLPMVLQMDNTVTC